MTPCILAGGTGYKTVKTSDQATKAHRIAYVKAHGLMLQDITGKVVMHKCDNPNCINPDHLELGTQRDNMQDCIIKGRRGKTGPARLLTPEQEEAIRKDFRTDERIARDYGVSPKTINRTKARQYK